MSPTLATILELASWAPSGDNTQPWRFEVLGDRHVVVHGFDTRRHCVYDLDGHASQLSLGALIETAAVAASAHGLRLDVARRPKGDDEQPTFDLVFHTDAGVETDDLIHAIRLRSVQRRPMKTRSLSAKEKQRLLDSIGSRYELEWLEGTAGRWRTAALLFGSAKLRLTTPEAYSVHRAVIQWRSRFSPDRVPDQALGVGSGTLQLMRFVMKSWGRVKFFNAFLAGTWLPRLQMDWLPGLACAAHFVLVARSAPDGIDEYVAAGRAVQRFWLAATRLGLVLQPELTPLIFARYARANTTFSSLPGAAGQARAIASALERLVGTDAARHGVFMGRIGAGLTATSRSTRRGVAELMDSPAAPRR